MFSLIKAVTMPQKELEEYYKKRRREKFTKNNGIPKHIKIHDFWNFLLVCGVSLFRILSGVNLTVCKDDRKSTDRPIVYACAHVEYFDVEAAFEVIKQPCWLMLGDARELYKSFDGFMLSLNGVIHLDTLDKEDRHIAKETAVQLLKNGGNLLIFPEGAWNTTENLPVMKLFCGSAEIAIRTHADIIPMAIEKCGNHIYAFVGENISSDNYALEDKHLLTEILRNKIAELRWNCWEEIGMCKRKDFPDNYGEIFLRKILESVKGYTYTYQDILDTMFNDKNIVTYQKAFEHLDYIKPCINNAFLFNKRLK